MNWFIADDFVIFVLEIIEIVFRDTVLNINKEIIICFIVYVI
jgi:hypothetical protein